MGFRGGVDLRLGRIGTSLTHSQRRGNGVGVVPPPTGPQYKFFLYPTASDASISSTETPVTPAWSMNIWAREVRVVPSSQRSGS